LCPWVLNCRFGLVWLGVHMLAHDCFCKGSLFPRV
jgi:hypothetical protein